MRELKTKSEEPVVVETRCCALEANLWKLREACKFVETWISVVCFEFVFVPKVGTVPGTWYWLSVQYCSTWYCTVRFFCRWKKIMTHCKNECISTVDLLSSFKRVSATSSDLSRNPRWVGLLWGFSRLSLCSSSLRNLVFHTSAYTVSYAIITFVLNWTFSLLDVTLPLWWVVTTIHTSGTVPFTVPGTLISSTP